MPKGHFEHQKTGATMTKNHEGECVHCKKIVYMSRKNKKRPVCCEWLCQVKEEEYKREQKKVHDNAYFARQKQKKAEQVA